MFSISYCLYVLLIFRENLFLSSHSVHNCSNPVDLTGRRQKLEK